MKYWKLSFIIMALSGCWSSAFGQSTLNPDISVIPRFRIDTDDGSNLPDERSFGKPRFSLEEFELALQAYLNPYARADIFIAKPGFEDEPVEIEEAYATFLRGLPLDMNIRLGKYLAEFGKLNTFHPHAWPFLSKPLSLERFLGEEGINDLGLSASFLIPTGDLYTRLTVDILQGHTVANGPGLETPEGEGVSYANSARLMSFFPVDTNSDLEIGLSGLTGIHDPLAERRFYYVNLDFKYKWKPDAYTSFVLQGEGLLNRRRISSDVEPLSEVITTSGIYVFGDYQFRKIFTLGARYDWAQSPYDKDDKASGFAIFFGFYPVEETTAFRLQFQNTLFSTPDGESRSVNFIALQFIFSMGPHKAHPF